MTKDRVPAIGAALAVLLLAVLVVLDLLVPPDVAILTALFGLAPLVACAVVGARGTAAIGILSVAAALGSGAWNDTFGTAQHNVRLLNVALVSIAAVAIAAIRVHREQRFDQMEAIAEAAQRAILPVLPAKAGPVVAASRYRSAARDALVGGDLYDCYHSSTHVRFIVGDVRGKGIAGVEQAARVIRAFRQSAALQPTLEGVAEEMDDYLGDFFADEEFVTALLVDATDPRRLTLLSAGHPAPALVRGDGTAVAVDPPVGLPFGMSVGSFGGHAQVDLPWSTGDRLLMYTDGLSEARDDHGRFLDVASLAPHLRTGSPDQALEAVIAAVEQHVPRGRLEDDLAIVLLEHADDRPLSTARSEIAGELAGR
jgi:phosphoserine phosphatase RsbU/P